MPLSLSDIQTINKISDCLYSFLPGTPHPYADSSISFPGVAKKLGLYSYWVGGSKKPAITKLLQSTLEIQRDKFCNLILEIVKTGMIYRDSKNNPITKEEIINLNNLIKQVNFKIPELWNSQFIDSLKSPQVESEQSEGIDNIKIERLCNDLRSLDPLGPQDRGFAFEKFLNELFSVYMLEPKKPFRLVGEQIDGSFQLNKDTYLVEAKWQNRQIGQSDLLVFREKVISKATWSRGLFVSYSGFTSEGLEAFARGRSTNIIGMNSQDLYFILNDQISLIDAINSKARRAAETGEFFVSVFSLIRSC